MHKQKSKVETQVDFSDKSTVHFTSCNPDRKDKAPFPAQIHNF